MCIFSPLNYSKALYCFCGYMYEIEYLCTVKHKIEKWQVVEILKDSFAVKQLFSCCRKQ